MRVVVQLGGRQLVVGGVPVAVRQRGAGGGGGRLALQAPRSPPALALRRPPRLLLALRRASGPAPT